jgi:hypothetical protein
MSEGIVEVRERLGLQPFTSPVPRLGWIGDGLQVYGTNDVSLVCTGNYSDFSKAQFTGFSHSQFHYCPTGRWADWVALAKRILDATISTN